MHVNGLVVLFLDSRGFGGIESHVFNLAKGLSANNVSVEIVFYQSYGKHVLFKELEDNNIPYRVLSGSLWSVVRYLYTRKPNLLHTHGYKAGILGRVLAKILKVSIVSTFHAGEPGTGKLKIYNLLDRFLSPLATCISVSKNIDLTLPTKSVVINNFAIEPRGASRHCFARKRAKIAFVGRLSPEKGPDIFCQLAKQIPQHEFVLFGDGPMLPDLMRFSNYVTFKGHVQNMDEEWSDIDILCITSRYEGLPMVAVEAMLRGIPVIAFDVGNIKELINNPDLGSVIRPSDIIAMKLAVLDWVKLPGNILKERKLKIISHTKKKFSSSAVLPQILAVYDSALGE